jgi:hypothetical protein
MDLPSWYEINVQVDVLLEIRWMAAYASRKQMWLLRYYRAMHWLYPWEPQIIVSRRYV